MAILDKLKAMLGSGGAERPAPGPPRAPEDRVQPGDEPVPAPVDTEPPHGDPMREP